MLFSKKVYLPYNYAIMAVSTINWLLAFSPILILIVLMTIFKFGGSKAGIITWLVAQIIAFGFFGTGIEILRDALIKSIFLALDVLLIIWGAMYLYQVTKAAGTIQQIGEFLSAFTHNKAYQGVFLGWLFPSFLQGMGGFGVPVAVSAPLLVSAGFSPLLSIVLTSIGHGWGVSFGSMGTSIRTLEAVTTLPFDTFAPASAILLGVAAIISGTVVVFIAGGKQHFLSALPLTILIATILSVGQYLIAQTEFWVIAVTLPALISLIIGLGLVGNFSKQSRAWVKQVTRKGWREIGLAVFPYVLLVFLILFFNFLQPLRDFLNPFTISLEFSALMTKMGFQTPAENSKGINIFLHPGTILVITGLITYYVLKENGYLKNKSNKAIALDTINSSIKTSIAIFSLVGAAVTMRHAGMISLLAQGISNLFPRSVYPIVAPFIGALGAFITGSNNNSNVLFAGLQLQTAQLLKLPVAWILAAQTTGAALGSIMAPAKVILGCNTVGLDGQEGQVISRLILTCIAIIFLIGIATFFLAK